MGKGRGPEDPLGNYIEWAEHRYNPGHYLGGTIEPHLRKSSLGPRARRLSGIMLVASGIAWLPAIVARGLHLGLLLEPLLPLLLIAAGVSLFRSAGTDARRRPRRTHARQRRS